MRLLILLLLLGLSGCAKVDTSIANLAKALNDRQVQSCIFASGLYARFISASIIMGTGGVSVHECRGEQAFTMRTPPRPSVQEE